MKKNIYFENLDGLRFFCFFAVFLVHSFQTEFQHIKDNPIYNFILSDIVKNGNLGVNFFFVLSGFLITYLLIEEKKLNGQINLPKFWIRRILRIWPLFYFNVAAGFLLFPSIKEAFGQVVSNNSNPLYYLFFINNFDFILNGEPNTAVLLVLWSVAIEEQFYLVWPLILYILPVKKYWIAFISVITTSIVFRAFNDVGALYEFHTLSCIGDMAIGAFGAWLIIEKPKFKLFIENVKKSRILIVYVLVALIFLFRDDFLFTYYPIRIFERAFIAIVFLFVILDQNYAKHSFFKMSNFKTLSNWGVVTYGLYCLHLFAIFIATYSLKIFGFNTQIWQVLILEPILAFILSIVISKISYKYYESPFLRLKDKFAFITKSK